MNPARDLVLFLITALVFLSPLSNLKAAIDWLKQTLKNIAAVRACVMIASITLTIRERTRSARTDFFSARKSILGDWRKLATLIYTLLLALTSFDSPIAIANAGPYQYARSFQEIGTFGLNMNLFRDSTDFKTIEKWARRGWGICSIDSKTIPKIQHALEEHLTGIGPELKDRPLKTIGWTSEGGRSGDMTLVEFSDHFGLGFAVDQTSFGEKIVNATVVSDDGVVILPLIGDGVLADYEALISKGGLTSDPELFAKIARRVIPLLQRKAENAAPTALMFQAVAENAQRVIAAPNDVPSFKALRAALGHFKGSKIMSDDHLN
jgi:hypothetical protein